MSETFGAWLEQKRLSVGLNQTELAERTDVSKTTISLYESDKIAQPRFSQLDKIAKVIGVSSDEIRKAWASRNAGVTNEDFDEIDLSSVRVAMKKGDFTEDDKAEFLDDVRHSLERLRRRKQSGTQEASPE